MRFKPRGYKLALIVLSLFALISHSTKFRRITATVGILLSSFILWFHRNPSRAVNNQGSYISPVDGKVQRIERSEEEIQISIYLGLTDVHTVRSMSSTTVELVNRKSGGNYPALLKNLSEKNNSLNYKFENGDSVSVFTGFLARRLINETKAGRSIEAGEEIGFISFGSRCVINISKDNIDSVEVCEGDTVRSGESVIGIKDY